MRECAEDRDEEEEALDDWFIESLKTYTDLHVYQLEHATRVLEWTSGRTVCVAGFSSSKNEILELSLPLRLLAEQNKGLCAERDFKVVHGGFSEAPIHSLKHIPGTRFAVSSDGQSSSLLLWDLGGDDSDVIRRTGQIDIKCESLVGGQEQSRGERGAEWGRGRKMAAPPSRCSEPKILHGATTNDVQLTDINTTKQLYRIQACAVSEPLSCLQFLSEGVFVCGSVNGSVLEVDSRSPAPPTCHPAPLPSDSTAWSMDVCGGGLVVRSRASGHTVVSDLRKMDSRLAQAQVTASDGKNRGSLNVTWAPALQHHIALSGVNGLVQIYNTSLWGAELQPAHAQFEHRGHVVSSHEDDVITTSHAWHPERPRTLLSAASDASVHVWDWNHQSESSK
ncbi:WD repeat-containing protein 73 [Periophthalmus magnuspinnatus]|uniref:WD repeat-containing protein 73 n=1 Tax=Periophthalmus magnuspinnatus TaxID=409849 RepID=UPI00145B35D1|nr:WD repeat-containing protein 73 [Periophthalmus magnuspinnatus]